MGVRRCGPRAGASALPSGPTAASGPGTGALVDGRRPGRGVEPALAPAAGKAERGDERADNSNPG